MSLSRDYIEAAFRGEPEPVAQLVTIRSDALSAPIRVTDWPSGLTSNSETYVHFPFELSWAASRQDAPGGEGQLAIANVDRRIEQACDSADVPPAIDLALVRVNDPDAVERAVIDARIPSVSGDAQKCTAIIRARNFGQEPAVAFSYTPARFDGLF